MNLKRLCPKHGLFGWSYNTHRRRRFCRFCAYQEKLDQTANVWIPAETELEDYEIGADVVADPPIRRRP